MEQNGTQTAAAGSHSRIQEEKLVPAWGEGDEVSRRLDDLLDYLENARNELSDDAQKALSELIVAMPYIERSGNPYLVGAAEVAARALYAKPQKSELARQLAKKIKRRLFLYRVLGPSPSTAVAFGLGLFFYLLAPFSVFIVGVVKGLDFDKLLGTSLGMILLVSLAGAGGSIVSILIRLQKESSNMKVWEPLPFLFTGLCKPIVGVAFALFVFVIINSGIIPVDIRGPEGSIRENHFFLAVAFIAGFSERFAKNIVKDVEKRSGAQTES